MKTIDVCLSPDLIHLYNLNEKVVVVVDILRATSCMVAGLGSGVHSITPFASLNECQKMSSSGYLIAGERNGRKVDSFDLGNSPFDYMSELVKGKEIATTTTNGTVAIEKSCPASKIIIGAFLNLSAVVKYLQNQQRSVLVLCAGWKGKVNMEDTLYAGALVERLKEDFQPECDGPLIAQAAYNSMKEDILNQIKQSSHARRLNNLDVSKDIEYCMSEDQFDVVPILIDGKLVVS